ncbi:MAG: amidohydrolase family protein [Planctomycetes bacterium]|nr:amidohydrolase family protein [Planctomycetota bacterium]
MIIDTHVHLSGDDVNGDALVKEADRLGIDKLVVFGTGGFYYDGPGNDECLAAASRHPDRIIPFAHLRLGYDDPIEIDKCVRKGFKGFKVLAPSANLNDRTYWSIYQRIQYYRVPVLFHLGILAVRRQQYMYDIDTSRMNPIYLDSILRAFPDLIVWGAHFGNPWYEQAAMLARWHNNLYFDLSGSSLKAKPPEFFGNLLWWKDNEQYGHGNNPWHGMLFGTDVSINMMEDVWNDYQRLMDTLKLDDDERRALMGENAARCLGLLPNDAQGDTDA